ncbi:unnamed protein product [Owenia fusiformis]|uniref:Carbohydrate deacetylase n=1 Tax=Owenia fusiformis TaxID=6347 RepID=A0A8S4Q7B1_OWEFU|nr:unnamed protein product [Owenia fusiformis]
MLPFQSVPANMPCKLIINADDFGYCTDRNRGILEAFKDGAITSATVLINARDTSEAITIATQHNIPIGLHLNLTEGYPVSVTSRSLTDPSSGAFLGKSGIREALLENKINFDEVKDEIEEQIKLFVDLKGELPTHMDGHQHVQVLPGICGTLAECMVKYGIKKTRVPYEVVLGSSGWIDKPQFQFYQSVNKDAELAESVFRNKGINFTHGFVGMTTMGSDMTTERLKHAIQTTWQQLHQENNDAQKFQQEYTVAQKDNPIQDDIFIELMVHVGYPSNQSNIIWSSMQNKNGVTYKNEPIRNKNDGPDEFSLSADRIHEKNILSSKNMKEFYKDNNIEMASFIDLI